MTNLATSKHVTVGNWEMELVDKYIYLSHKIWISRDNQTCELQRGTTPSLAAYGKLKDVVVKNDLPICLKRKVFNHCVLLVRTYGAETVTLTVASAKMLRITLRKTERSFLCVQLQDYVRNDDCVRG